MQESEKPLVSVLMPVFNGAKYLSYTIENILTQSYKNIELIVVDDGSTDDSYNIAYRYVNEYEWRVKVFSQPNSGACVARTRALKESTGKYVMFMDADDLISPQKIEYQMEILRKNNKYTIVSSEWDIFYTNINEAKFPKRCIYKDYTVPLNMLIEMMEKGEMMLTSCWLTSRELIESVGEWDPRFTINDDGVYFSKVLTKASKVCFCSGAYVYYRRGHPSLSTENIYGEKKLRALLDSYKEQSKILLAHTLSADAYRGIARCFALVMCKAQWNSPIYKEAKDAIIQLGLQPSHPYKGSNAYKVSRLIRFENFLRLRYLWKK